LNFAASTPPIQAARPITASPFVTGDPDSAATVASPVQSMNTFPRTAARPVGVSIITASMRPLLTIEPA
jgi:hypothetical protein